MTYEATRRVETSARTFTIIEHLDRAGPSRVSAIAADLEMTKGIVHNHLSTLRELGYVRKVDGRYQLSTKFLPLGQRVRTQSPLYQAAHSLLGPYASRVNSGVVLYTQAGRDVVVIDTHGLPASVDLDVGTIQRQTESLAGVVMRLESGVDALAASSPYESDSLASQLEADGIAVGRVSSSVSARGCGIPISTESGDCLGSLVVLLPAADDRLDEIRESVTALCKQIEHRYAGTDTTDRSFATEKHAWIDS